MKFILQSSCHQELAKAQCNQRVKRRVICNPNFASTRRGLCKLHIAQQIYRKVHGSSPATDWLGKEGFHFKFSLCAKPPRYFWKFFDWTSSPRLSESVIGMSIAG